MVSKWCYLNFVKIIHMFVIYTIASLIKTNQMEYIFKLCKKYIYSKK